MLFPQEIIEEVRAATDIIDIVGDYVQLKKRGANYFGLCPFHNEKTPSFSVNPALGIYKCFGCGEAGDVFRFVMSVERIGFTESVRMLAERAGIPLPTDQVEGERYNEIEAVYHALRFAARYYFQQLTVEETGKEALKYFRRRGFTAKTIKHFGLGYAPKAWDGLLKNAVDNHITPEILEKAGLVIRRTEENDYFDRFRDRVIFPIFSHVGKVQGFGGRIIQESTDQPKYINTPETIVYKKSRVLYGLFQGKHAIRKKEEALLVEGYTDVISLHQAGIEYAIASSGTALTTEQLKLLSRYAKRIVLLYDADSAGAAASLRGIDLALDQGLAVYAVALPAGQDPDSFIRENGGEAFEEYLQRNRQDFISFKYQAASRAGAFDTPEGRAASMRSVVETVARIPDPLMVDTYMRRASEVLGVPDIRLYEVLDEIKRTQKKPEVQVDEVVSRPSEARGVDGEDRERAISDTDEQSTSGAQNALPEEKILIRLMLENGAEMVEFILRNMALDEFSEGPSRRLVEFIIELYEKGEVKPQRLLDSTVAPDIQNLATEVLIDRYEPSENWQKKRNIPVPRMNEDPYEAATSAMVLLKLDRVNDAIEKQQELIFNASKQGDNLRQLQEEMMSLLRLRSSIERREFLTWHSV